MILTLDFTVAKQCLETAFDYDPQTDSTICSVPYQLEEIFTAGLAHLQQQVRFLYVVTNIHSYGLVDMNE